LTVLAAATVGCSSDGADRSIADGGAKSGKATFSLAKPGTCRGQVIR
jgi:hypothetical protein